MYINEVSKKTGLTKKAIEYYTLKGLVSPAVLENGYRDYSEDDLEKLSKISILRKLDAGMEDIRAVLSKNGRAALQKLALQKELNLQREEAKKQLLDQLSSGKSYREINEGLQILDNNKTITERLLEAFPGYFGRYVALHFSKFLNEPIKTKQQQSAYQTILTFLDDMPSFTIPDDLQEYYEEGAKHVGTAEINKMLENVKHSINNPEEFITDNKEFIEDYVAFKQSDEFKNSPAYRLMELTKHIFSTNGYYDVFIPALKELSSSYLEYSELLEAANQKILAEYPEVGNL